MNDPPDGDVRSLNADSLTLTAECNHVLYKPCIVININKPHLETGWSKVHDGDVEGVEQTCSRIQPASPILV